MHDFNIDYRFEKARYQYTTATIIRGGGASQRTLLDPSIISGSAIPSTLSNLGAPDGGESVWLYIDEDGNWSANPIFLR